MNKLVLAGLVALATSAAAPAQAFTNVGPHLGFSVDPDQVVFGGQATFGDVAPSLDFVPSVDFGIGDNVTTISFNGDFHYRFPIQGARWEPYAGGGVTISHFSLDTNGFGDASATEAGGSFMIGADVPTRTGARFFTELKIGFGDGSPDFKALAGWNFKLK